MPHGHAHLHTLDHAFPIGYGHAHAHAHSHSYGGYTTLAPKPTAGGSPNGRGNMAAISGSAPNGTTSSSRVDSLRSGQASGSGGTTGPMKEVKRDKTEMRVVEKERACRKFNSCCWRGDEEG
jgi:hypothetical protein